MEFCALKYQIEQMRRHPSIVGYVITEFTDVHWECNGLLDMCRNPKAFYDSIADVNSADAIVPDWGERVAYWEGERCEIRVALSHFSNLDLGRCRLEWALEQHPSIRGAFEDFTPGLAQVTHAGTIVFDVPAMPHSARVRLTMRLYDEQGAFVTRNHVELYCFPRRLATPPVVRVSAPPALARSLRSLGYTIARDLDGAA